MKSAGNTFEANRGLLSLRLGLVCTYGARVDEFDRSTKTVAAGDDAFAHAAQEDAAQSCGFRQRGDLSFPG